MEAELSTLSVTEGKGEHIIMFFKKKLFQEGFILKSFT